MSQVSESNGIGGTLNTSYTYSGYFSNPGASWSHGYAQIVATDPHGNITTSNYYTDFARSGQLSSQTEVLGGVTLRSLTNTVASNLLGTGNNGVSYYAIPVTQSVTTEREYNSGSAITTTTTTFAYDAYGNITTLSSSVSDGSSSTVTRTYANDEVRWLLGQLTNEVVQRTVGNSTITNHTDYTHDPATGFLTQKVIEPGDSAHQITSSYSYDSFGNVISTNVSATGLPSKTTTTTYDSNGIYPTSACNAAQECHNYVRGSDPDGYGNSILDTGPNGVSTRTSYDLLGRIVRFIGADGNQIVNGFGDVLHMSGYSGPGLCNNSAFYYGPGCPAGTVYAVLTLHRDSTAHGLIRPYIPNSTLTNLNGPESLTYYDSFGRVIATDKQGMGGAWIRQSQTYDSFGNVAQVSRPYFVNGGAPKWTTFTYDPLGRVLTATAPDGGVTSYSYNGLTTSVTNALNQTTTTVRNAQGFVASVTDALGHATSYGYDAAGNLKTVTDPSGNVITNTFDVVGNKTASSDPDMGSWSYSYNAFGQLVSQTDAKGQTTSLSYDAAGRTTFRSELGLFSSWTYGTSTASHNVGALIEAKACSTSGCSAVVSDRTISYDALGRPATSNLVAGGNYAYATTYDSNGRIATVTYPSGLILAYVYDAYGYLTRINNNATGSAYWTANTRDAEMHLLSQTFGNGVSQTNWFDANTGFLTNFRAGTNNPIAGFDYTYDTLGNLTYRADGWAGTFEYACYDSLNRLTNYATGNVATACTSSGSKTVGYDATGNILSKSGVGTYGYPSAGMVRPHALSGITGTVNGVVNPSYGYDANGNMVSGGGRTVSYTAFNMADTITVGSTSVSFVYDSEHSRVSQTLAIGSNTTTTTYLNDPVSGAMSEKAVSGGTTVWHDYITVGGRIVAEKFTGGTNSTRYFLADHLGSTSIVMDESGTVVERNAYDPWGKRRYFNGSDDAACSLASLTSRGFTGHEHIDGECLINMNARIYDPVIGRFLAADTVVSSPHGSQAFNRYAYVMNNPLSATDPTGHDCEPSPDRSYLASCGRQGVGYAEMLAIEVVPGIGECHGMCPWQRQVNDPNYRRPMEWVEIPFQYQPDMLNTPAIETVIAEAKKIEEKVPNSCSTQKQIDCRRKAALKTIRQSEFGRLSDADYYGLYGGESFTDTASHPNIPSTAWGRTSTAAGAYQILYGSWNRFVNINGPHDFSPASQDAYALWAISGRHALGYVDAGNWASATARLNNEWSSLPGGSQQKYNAATSQSMFDNFYNDCMAGN